MIALVRKCPGCKEEHPEEIILCPTTGWDLTQEPLKQPGGGDEPPAPLPLNERRCHNGHLLEIGYEICLECGEGVSEEEPCPGPGELPPTATTIDGWTVVEDVSRQNESYEQFIVERHGHQALLILYRQEAHPHPAIYETFKRLPKEYTSEIQAIGDWQERRYEILELNSEGNLLDFFPDLSINTNVFRQIVKSVGLILDSMGQVGLRHCNIRPENILIRGRDSLDLALTGFQYARLSAFDLDTIPQPESARYLAPEVMAGGVSIASDWWSLGMVLLQLATNSRCFEGINEKAFRIHVVTRGITIPKGLDPETSLLLRGLLARDPDKRWQWQQIQSWLAGEPLEMPSEGADEEERKGPSIELYGRTFLCPKAFALAGAEPQNWEAGRDLLMRGVIATWLEKRRADSKIIAGVRLAASLEAISEDFRYSLSLMWLNPNLPLTLKGEIINPAWLLQNASQGYEIITGPVAIQLRQMGRESHICELHNRIKRAREKAKVLEIELNEECFCIISLTASRQSLENGWVKHRRLYPGSDHEGLNSLMERQKIGDEDLIILLGASTQQYESAEQILTKAADIASKAEIKAFDRIAAEKWFEISRRELFREIEGRLANYARCRIARADEWADEFRINRRMSLPKALVLLAIPAETWKELRGQQRVATILEFFEKRTASLAQRGPLVRMLIGKTSARVDVSLIRSKKHSAASIIEHLVGRKDSPLNIDRSVFETDPDLERRLRHLIGHARTYRRDTGIDSLYLGFPFLVMCEDRSSTSDHKKPRIAPLFLWPVKIDLENRDRASIFFDRDREEVRLNPALASLVGPEEAKQWKEIGDELLGRSSLQMGDVIDAFGSLVEPRERTLCELPSKDYKIKSGVRQIVCSGVFFHAEFMGQAIGEDLRQLRRKEPAGTGLSTALRLSSDQQPTISSVPIISEDDRYLAVESDPSQERAIFQARQAPGLLIEGPPGTGKSQTIVNMVADCIGRRQTVLIVCQKQAALEVLAKRLDAEGLSSRFFYITNINKDRTPVIQAIRNQLDNITQSFRDYRAENVNGNRQELARRIEKLENEIDRHHIAIHAKDEATGLSYRSLLGQLIDLEDSDQELVDIPALRELLMECDQEQLSAIEEACSPLAVIWLESRFEGSPLASLRTFSSDTAWIKEFFLNLRSFMEIENARDEVISLTPTSFDVEDPVPHQTWISKYDKTFNDLSEATWKNLAAWRDLFRTDILGRSRGREAINALEKIKLHLSDFVRKFVVFAKAEDRRDKIINASIPSFEIDDPLSHRAWIDKNDKLLRNMNDSEWKNLSAWFDDFSSDEQSIQYILNSLEDVKQDISSFNRNEIDPQLAIKLVDLPFNAVSKWLSMANAVVAPDSFFDRIALVRTLKRRRIQKFLSELEEEHSDERMDEFRKAADFENKMRPIRELVLKFFSTLYPAEKSDRYFLIQELEEIVNKLIREVRLASEAVQAILSSPRREEAIAMARIGSKQAFLEMLNRYEGAFSRCEARSESNQALELLSSSTADSLITLWRLHINLNLTNSSSLQTIIECHPFLEEESSSNCLDLSEDCVKDLFSASSEENATEKVLVSLRKDLFNILARFYPRTRQISGLLSLEKLQPIIKSLLNELQLVEFVIQAIHEAPRKNEAEEMAEACNPQAYQQFMLRYEDAFSRHQARTKSVSALEKLSSAFSESLIARCKSGIQKNTSNLSELVSIVKSLHSLSAYQEFRLRVPALSEESMKVFSVMREKENELKDYPKEQLETIVRRLIAREGRLAWKDRLEQRFPILRLVQKELSRKIENLDKLNEKMRQSNRRYLTLNVDLERVQLPEDWENITRFRGPRSRRLREVFEMGSDMGLLQLRPVWLMNPDTASLLLPLRPGLFDVVIFDEASQIPVENALPTLYRAKRSVISGDEKQMPPNTVFVKKFSDEDPELYDGELDDCSSEAERADFEDSWNQREIKDCPDLLTLGKTILPKTMLQIHYRSKYRELISFSNAAFYNGKLSVPVRHPDHVIEKIQPIEIVRVNNGIYENQTNRREAEKVVALLAQIWASSNHPSIGVVTFNAKQADLIEDVLEDRAEKDSLFRDALASARNRQQDGEDMSFFVKNVENVQGDERDMIIFSSTFGRDPEGSFRRQFGLLSQVGGERRLNVAITRAREKVILVTSLPINEISDALSKRQSPKIARDYLQAYFDYASKVSDGSLELARNSLKTMTPASTVQTYSYLGKDGFMRSVANFIESFGLKPLAIVENDAFGLDFVIEDHHHKRFGIGIECDAHCHPILETARAREIWRPKVLSKVIPHVHRVTSYGWYHRREEEMEQLKLAIEKALTTTLKKTIDKFQLDGERS